MESVFVVFSPGHLSNTSAGGTGYVGVGALSALFCVRDGCRDACRPMFSSEIFSAGLGVSGFGRDPCCDACCDGRLLRPVEALPLSERLGHTMLWFLEGFAAFAYKMSEAALLGWGLRENIRILTVFEIASLALGMQNSAGRSDAMPRTFCLNEMVPNGTSRPSCPARALPPSAPDGVFSLQALGGHGGAASTLVVLLLVALTR